MRRTRIAALATAAVAAAAFVPGAGTAVAQDASCTATETLEVGGFYVQVRNIEEGSVWVYQESNGTAGLQPGGTSDLSDDTACQTFDEEGNPITPDTLIF